MSLSLGAGLTVTTALPSSGTVVVPVVGPPGPQGPPGAVIGSFLFTQVLAQSVWQVQHNLGRYPVAWSLFETASGRLCTEYTVEHIDVNNCRVSMDTPTAGTIRLL